MIPEPIPDQKSFPDTYTEVAAWYFKKPATLVSNEEREVAKKEVLRLVYTP